VIIQHTSDIMIGDRVTFRAHLGAHEQRGVIVGRTFGPPEKTVFDIVAADGDRADNVPPALIKLETAP